MKFIVLISDQNKKVSHFDLEADDIATANKLAGCDGRLTGCKFLIRQAKNSLVAIGQAIQNPKLAPKEEKERRLVICHDCDFYENGKCLQCGCHISLKAILEVWHCPIEKW